ncbi:hypothetical protein OSTOST_10562 [Ostertagia ostertagi]
MKKLYTLLAGALLVSAAANAQRLVDISATMVAPAANATITSGTAFASSIVIKNLNLGENTSVSVRVTDLTGRVVAIENKGTMSKGKQAIKISVGDIASGIYLYQALIRRVPVPDNVLEYAVGLVHKTRPSSDRAPEAARQYIAYGAGPRASQYLVLGAKCHALLNGKFSPDIEDVRAMALPVLRHRVVRNYKAEAEGVDNGKGKYGKQQDHTDRNPGPFLIHHAPPPAGYDRAVVVPRGHLPRRVSGAVHHPPPDQFKQEQCTENIREIAVDPDGYTAEYKHGIHRPEPIP